MRTGKMHADEVDTNVSLVRRLLAAQHRIDPAVEPPSGRGGPLETRDAPTRTAIDALLGIVDTDAVTATWEAALQTPVWPGSPVCR